MAHLLLSSTRSFRVAAASATLLAAVSARASTVPTPGSSVVGSFESTTDITMPRFFASLAKVALTGGATDGNSALAVSVPASGPGTYPAISMYPACDLNLAASGGLAFDIANTSSYSITFTLKLKDANGATMERPATLPAGGAGTYRLGSENGLDPAKYGVAALPNPFKGMTSLQAWTTGAFDLSRVTMIQIYVRAPQTEMSYTVDNFRLLPAFSMTDYLTGLVDQFGQNAKEMWPNKLTSTSQFAARDAAEQIDLARNQPVGWDEFGGLLNGPKSAATGSFRTEKIGGRWWFIDPKGNPFFSSGINNVDPEAPTLTKKREWMFSTSTSMAGGSYDFYAQNLATKYGKDCAEEWAANAERRLRSWGFNTLGNWSSPSLAAKGTTPYVLGAGTNVGNHHTVSTGLDYWGKLPDPFDPAFAPDVVQGVSKISYLARKDRFIGYMVDNELSWTGVGPNAEWGIAYGAMREAMDSSPAKRGFFAQLQAKYPSIAALNAAWGTSYSSWNDLKPALEMPAMPNSNQKADMDAFVLAYARKYFAIVRNAVRAVSPKALYMGCRFAWYTPAVVKAADEYCDVISFNYYADRFDPAKFAFTKDLMKPCMMSEFSYGATDRGLPYSGLVQSTDQSARASAMQDYVRSVASMPNFIGAHWFQYMDEPLLGRPLDGSNGNIGMVDVTDTPYPEMIAAARKANADVYRVHQGS